MKRQTGFTLIELVIVMVIMGVVGIVIFAVIQARGTQAAKAAEAKRELVQQYASAMQSWVETHRQVNGALPDTSEFQALDFDLKTFLVGQTESNYSELGQCLYRPSKSRQTYVIYGINAKGDTVVTLTTQPLPSTSRPL